MVREETEKIACCCEGAEVVLCDDRAEAILLWLVLFCFQKTGKRNCNTIWAMLSAIFQLPVEKTPCQSSLKELTALVIRKKGCRMWGTR